MEIEKIRNSIDEIDTKLTELFSERMKKTKEIAEFKKENNLNIYNGDRERKVLNRVTGIGDNKEMENYISVLYSTIFDVSRAYQNRLLKSNEKTELEKIINFSLMKFKDKKLPSRAIVACQGVEGAYSQIACEKMFSLSSIMYMSSFEGVFASVEKGMCEYGILPIENSFAGSVTQVYDLMKKYNFYIAKSLKMKIDHCLLTQKGGSIENITEIYSHEQAINQCSEFFKQHPKIKINICENTAIAAQIVASSERNDIAAISSRNCAKIYNLIEIDGFEQNKNNNYTRFICISKNLEIYPGSNKISLMLSAPHKAGSLYHILSRFYSQGINLTKIESRPIAEKDFEFMFYFDIEASVLESDVLALLNDLSNSFSLESFSLESFSLESFSFLGNYSEK